MLSNVSICMFKHKSDAICFHVLVVSTNSYSFAHLCSHHKKALEAALQSLVVQISLIFDRLLNNNLLEGRVPVELYAIGVQGGAVE